ncbi:hypothetical protein BJ875DRAFT_540671 [Amylocarpus encephaloides]|uniref:Uncharacterized protein n=1 Tax=Amylocarpus encephaloides TaxID=45428 RepID=A0A9P7YPA8_9HELO|nr:hypothetical protein BJ875DRAFT_540671 [Amylocarpus encephaloides]
MGRRNDKSAIIRAGWTTAIGRVLVTSAGGIGLSREEEASLVRGLGEKLNDSDDKVRLAAVKAVGGFSFRDIITKLAPNGSVSKYGSVLCSLSDRVRDRKSPVRVEGMTTLARIWGVAAGEIASGNDAVISTLGDIPSKIFDVYYVNDLELNVLLDHVMYEQLVPLKYPPGKPKGPKAVTGESQGQSQVNSEGRFNADKIRTERILLVAKSLNAKSKKAFLAMQARQPTFAEVLSSFLQTCEKYNGGVMDENSKSTKAKLDKLVEWLAKLLPDHMRASQDLLKFAELHDRRTYQLLRFAMAAESDFKTVHNSIKEFAKRIETAQNAPAGLLEALLPIIYRSSSLIYNRSHLPYIMQYARSDEHGLGAIAHEIMYEISEKRPTIFKDNVKELCKSLAEQAPSSTQANDSGSVEALKALALFAKNENSSKEIPRDANFISTLMSFALYSIPPKAAKYAVSILMASSDKREMHGKDLIEKSAQDWMFGEDHFLTKLATISQLTLSSPAVVDDANDEILDITTQQLLLKVRTSVEDDDPEWKSDTDLDEECQAKCWALRILVNRLRSAQDKNTAKALSVPIFKLLNALIVKGGEISKGNPTPKYHASRLRLLAAQSMLKLCANHNKWYDEFTTPNDFNRLAFVAQDAQPNVRRGFVEKLQKYLVKGKLSNRFYTIMFLTAFEPDLNFRASIVTWLRSRAKVFRAQKSHDLEKVFPRLVALLAHHPDFSLDPAELTDHARYIMYYITAIITEDNLPLVYKYAERVKQAKDGMTPSSGDNIYVLSDLSTNLLKKWQEKKGWIMQTWAGKVGLPVGLYGVLPGHAVAQEIAEKQYLPEPEEMEENLDELVKSADKRKKRRSDDRDNNSHPAKKIKSEPKSRVPKTPQPRKDKVVKPKKTPSAKPKKHKSDVIFSTPASSSQVDRRKSGRGASAKKTYAEQDESEADKEMWEGVAEWEYLSESDSEMPKRKRKPAKPSPDSDEEGSSSVEEPADEEEAEGEQADVEMPDAAPQDESEPEPEEDVEVEGNAEDSAEEVEEEVEEVAGELSNVELLEDEEAKPTPLRSNGKKKSARPPKAQAPKATSSAAKSKAKSSPAMKTKVKASPVKSKAKPPIVRATRSRPSRSGVD